MPIILTRPVDSLFVLEQACHQAGLPYVSLPLMKRQALMLSDSQQALLEKSDFLFFTNSFAVESYFSQPDKLLSQCAPLAWGCVGKATAKALQKYGVNSNKIIQSAEDKPADAHHFYLAFKQHPVFQQCQTTVLLGAAKERDDLLENLVQEGKKTYFLPIYERHSLPWSTSGLETLRQSHDAVVWLLSSTQSALEILRRVEQNCLWKYWDRQSLLCIHPRIKITIEQALLKTHRASSDYPKIFLCSPENSSIFNSLVQIYRLT